MKVIALLNEKGGTGKSTLSVNLARALALRGKNVAIVDADTQGTARDWRNATPEGLDLPPVIPLDRPQVLRTGLKSIQADVVVIDAPGNAADIASQVVGVADIGLVVLAPSAADAWASISAVQLITNKRNLGGNIEAGFLLNRVDDRTSAAKYFKTGEWNEYPIDFLDATVSYRASFVNSLGVGVTVYETDDKRAQADVDAVIDELESRKWL